MCGRRAASPLDELGCDRASPSSLAAAAGRRRRASTCRKWSPEYIRSIAGTDEVDTAAECAKVVPLDYKGRVTYWCTGPTDA